MCAASASGTSRLWAATARKIRLKIHEVVLDRFDSSTGNPQTPQRGTITWICLGRWSTQKHAATWRRETQAELTETRRAKSMLDCQSLAGEGAPVPVSAWWGWWLRSLQVWGILTVTFLEFPRQGETSNGLSRFTAALGGFICCYDTEAWA